MSGVMCIITTGIVMSHYATPNLSEHAKHTIATLVQTISFLCEIFVFVYMGMALFSFENKQWSYSLILIGLV